MMDMKIGIVGGGINGTYLAWKLAKEHDVTLFEKRTSVGKRVCSGLVSERLWDFIPESKKILQHKIDKITLHFPQKTVTLDLFPDMLVLDRMKLDKYVLSLAEEAGATIELGKEVKKVYQLRGMKPQLSVSGKIYEFDYILGCDGYFSIVRDSIGIKSPKYRLGIYTYVNKKSDSKIVDVYPTENGFFWKIPRKTKTEYGVLESAQLAKKTFNKFCKRFKVKPKKIYSYVVPYGLTDPQKGKIALCGDVIGLTKPWSGGGVIWSLKADDILVKTFPNFINYHDKLRRYFEAKIFFSKVIEKMGRFVGYKFPQLAPSEIYFDGDWVF